MLKHFEEKIIIIKWYDNQNTKCKIDSNVSKIEGPKVWEDKWDNALLPSNFTS